MKNTVRVAVLFLFINSFTSSLWAQLIVSSSIDADFLAQKLVGAGVTVTNATLLTVGDASGHFTQTNTNLGIDSGILLTSGSVFNAPGPNTIASQTTDNYAPGDFQLDSLIVPYFSQDATILEFDVTVAGDSLKFNYVFASEEYNDFVNTGFNDVFAFFISGPGLGGTKNIALVPNTTVPVTINNVNCGSFGTYYFCNDPWNQFNGGCTGQCPSNANGTTIEYDGFTVLLQALAQVQPCETYHLKIAIADAGDGAYDSGVFLQAGSLSSSGTSVSANTPYIDPTVNAFAIVEGCFPGSFDFVISNPPTDTVYINYTIGGTAIEGDDYATIPDSIQVLPGEQGFSLDIDPSVDGNTEGGETVIIYLFLPCTAEPYDSAVIYIFDEMNIIAGPDTAICIGQSVQLFSIGGIPGLASWQWSPSSGLSCDTCVNPFATPLGTTDYIVGVTIGNCTQFDTVTVIVNSPLPVLVGPDLSICLDDSVQLNAQNGNSYSWTPSAGLSCDDCANPWASPETTTTYIVTGENACFTSSDTITIVVNPSVNASAGGDATVCPGESVQLTSSGGVTYAWSPQNGLDDPNIQNPVATVFTTTIYTVLVTNSFGCTDTANVTIIVYDIPEITLTDDTTIYLGNSVDLEVTGGVSYSWNPPTYLTDPNSPNPTSVLPGDTITYYVTVISPEGCVNVDSVTIYVRWDALVMVPSAFSPNNDGKNDWFRPIVRGIFTLNHINVYNRWGEIVFTMNDLNTSGWNGEYKGEPQPMGVYVYELAGLDYVGNSIRRQGNVTLVR